MSYNQNGDPIEPDHYDYHLDMIMDAPIETLSSGELRQRALTEKNQAWFDMKPQVDVWAEEYAKEYEGKWAGYEQAWESGNIGSEEIPKGYAKQALEMAGINSAYDYAKEMMQQETTPKEYKEWLRTTEHSKIEDLSNKDYLRTIREKERQEDAHSTVLEHLGDLVNNGGDILKAVEANAKVDVSINGDSNDLVDLSSGLNRAIQKCCDEYAPKWLRLIPYGKTGAAIHDAVTWKKGVFGNWNFVGDTLWNDRKDSITGELLFDSYIPDEIQGLAKDAQKDFFIVNGIRMNREQYGNYVKGATAQYAFPEKDADKIVNIMGVGMSVYDNIEDNIKQNNKYAFDWYNEFEDAYFTYLGARDVKDGVIFEEED